MLYLKSRRNGNFLSLLLQHFRDKDGEGIIQPDERWSFQVAQTRKKGELFCWFGIAPIFIYWLNIISIPPLASIFTIQDLVYLWRPELLIITELPYITVVQSLNCCPQKAVASNSTANIFVTDSEGFWLQKLWGFPPPTMFLFFLGFSALKYCWRSQMTQNFSEEIRKFGDVLHRGFFITCIYLKPKTKLTGLAGIFSLTPAGIGSAFKLLIHRIQSFAIDVSGISAFWQIKSSKNPHFEWKSRMCQAWCSMLFFSLVAVLPARSFCYTMYEPSCFLQMTVMNCGVLGKHAFERCSVFLHALYFAESQICGSSEIQLYLKLFPTTAVFHWNQPVMPIF